MIASGAELDGTASNLVVCSASFQVEELVQEESFAYYDHILESVLLGPDGGVATCSRPGGQRDGRAKLTLGKGVHHGYAFCILCRPTSLPVPPYKMTVVCWDV